MREITRLKIIGPTPRQILAARVALKWSQQELADLADVGIASVRRLEALKSTDKMTDYLRPRTIEKIVGALQEGGIEFIEENTDRVGVMFSRFPARRS